jgi:hypothetical protein
MDWPVSLSYVQKLGDALGIRVVEHWREGGFLREMLRDDQSTAPVSFQTLDGEVITVGCSRGPKGVGRKFPQVTANLQQRWCSAACKIDVFARILTNVTNDLRFRGQRILVVTGGGRKSLPLVQTTRPSRHTATIFATATATRAISTTGVQFTASPKLRYGMSSKGIACDRIRPMSWGGIGCPAGLVFSQVRTIGLRCGCTCLVRLSRSRSTSTSST